MIDLNALTRALPAYRIQTDEMAHVAGRLSAEPLIMLVPPCGWVMPAVEPAAAIAFALIEAGWKPEEAQSAACKLGADLLTAAPVGSRPVMIDESANTRSATSISLVASALNGFGERERSIGAEMLRHGKHLGTLKLIREESTGKGTGMSLADLVDGPLPRSWTEAWFDLGGDLAWSFDDPIPSLTAPQFGTLTEAWLQAAVLVAGEIAAVIGTPVLDRPGDEEQNGYDYHGDVHRWLILDFACYCTPDSAFVKYLLEVSGAPSVAALRAVLRSPASYSPDFRLADAFTHYLVVNREKLTLGDADRRPCAD